MTANGKKVTAMIIFKQKTICWMVQNWVERNGKRATTDLNQRVNSAKLHLIKKAKASAKQNFKIVVIFFR